MALAEAIIEETGAVESIKKPQIVVSLLCTAGKGYLGISLARENLSDWPGGARHFAQTPEQISRAEFKLLEALEVFGVTLPTQGRVLDLGAAPGGWTRTTPGGRIACSSRRSGQSRPAPGKTSPFRALSGIR